MSLGTVRLGRATVSRLIIGGNPFSGFAHQTPERSQEMMDWYTVARIKAALRQAEELGVTTHLGRADHHVMRTLREYWNEGGRIQWIAQTCPGVGPIERGVRNAIEGRAVACFVHGGVMDYAFANDGLDEVPPAIDMIKRAGLACGIACHNPAVLGWAEKHLDVDFYMTCYYNSEKREQNAERNPAVTEWFRAEDRDEMVRTIAGLSKPAIHYKVLAAGRNDPRAAFDFVADHLRPQDAVCIGVFTKDKPDMLAQDLHLLEEALRRRGRP
jgi:hypothetical protein